MSDATPQASCVAVTVLVMGLVASVIWQMVVVGFTGMLLLLQGPWLVLAHIASVGAWGSAHLSTTRVRVPFPQWSVLTILTLGFGLICVAGTGSDRASNSSSSRAGSTASSGPQRSAAEFLFSLFIVWKLLKRPINSRRSSTRVPGAPSGRSLHAPRGCVIYVDNSRSEDSYGMHPS
ncbi:hypothetical protein CAPTEDRAFT_210421 [Capitella teleta]|uniref:Uncharacterized protein n=1 Tax=Capitella teleta TaxID=283909 RepID=N1PB58_CAPTE|nr:hypothetical protein CAPTEDRAFT_210421 [Capitella teleta]|eukprot:ELU18937.1 hypothetical protein CAPTEDRAFT_210421 [Capitella teleta]